MVVIGGGKHRLPVRAIGGLADRYVSSTVVLGSGEVAEVEASSREVIESSAQQSVLAYSLGTKTMTKVDGNRYLVNEGTERGEFPIFSGQGLRFDGTNAISNIGTLDLTKDFTVLWNQEKTVELGQHGSHNTDGGSYFGFDSAGLSVGIGVGWKGIPIAGQLGRVFSFFIRYTASTKLVEIGTLDLTMRDTFNAGNYGTLLPMDLGWIANNAIVAVGTLKDFYHLPDVVLTDHQLTMYRQKPELLLSKKNGVLQSGILDVPTLDLLRSGVGCWLPLCEGLGQVVYNNANLDEVKAFTPRSDWTEIVPNTEYLFDSSGVVGERELLLNLTNGVYDIEVEVTDYEVGQLYYVGGAGTFKLITNNGNTSLLLRAVIVNNLPALYVNAGIESRMRVTIGKVSRVYPITNALASDIWGNADFIPTGLQAILLELDARGVITGLSDRVNFDDKSYIDMSGGGVVGDWYFDLLVDTSGVAQTSTGRWLTFPTVGGGGDIQIYAGASVINVKVGTSYVTTGKSKIILSFECVNGSLQAYVNKTPLATSPEPVSQLLLGILGGAASGAAVNVLGALDSFGLSKTRRTPAEMVNQVDLLMNKHGVV